MSVYRIHDSSIFDLGWHEKFIKHHKAIQKIFGGKYKRVSGKIIAKTYGSLGKVQLKEWKIFNSLTSFINSFLYDRKYLFCRIYSKVFK